MRVRATTAGYHLFGDDLFVQGRLEVQWKPDGRWFKIAVDNYEMSDWQLTLLVWGLAAKEGVYDFEHIDVDNGRQLPLDQEAASGSNA